MRHTQRLMVRSTCKYEHHKAQYCAESVGTVASIHTRIHTPMGVWLLQFNVSFSLVEKISSASDYQNLLLYSYSLWFHLVNSLYITPLHLGCAITKVLKKQKLQLNLKSHKKNY